MKDKKIHTLVMTVFMQRTFAVLCFILLSVLTTLGATVTETFTVSSSTTVPTAGQEINHTDNVSVQYGSETNDDLEWGTRTFNKVTYIRRSAGPKNAAVVDGSVSGYFFAITPTKSGTLSVTVYMNSSNKTIYCSTVENSSFNNLSTITVESAGQYVFSDISVEANKTYYVYTTGTGELHFGGYTFTPSDSTDDSGDDDDDSSSTETPEGTKNTLKIDFNNDNNSNYNDANYTAWLIDNLEPSDDNLPSCEKTFSATNGNVTIKIQAVQDTIKIKHIWYKTMLQTDGSDKLINDGITGVGYKNSNDYNLSSGRMAIKFTITGLSKGQHSIQAFHNNVEFGAGSTAPDIFVDVNDVNVLGNIAQTYREQDRSLCAKSYITFDVASSDAETEILYYTLAESDETYTRNNFCINSLEIDASDIDDFAQKPYPANLDWHVETPNNSVTLSWATAVNGADAHVIYFGTDEDAVKNGTAERTEQTVNTLTKTGLSPLKRYYWRVDEVKDGTTTEGDVWSFQPRRLAFPGADGAGKYAVGGRGYNDNGVVYHVTSLEDNVSNPTEGTLRYGVEKLTGPRTIVFDVAGIITLTDRLNASDPYITVAGQTAPGIGVLLRYNTYGANGPDNITRFMNFRYGHGDDWKEDSANQNVGGSAGMAGADNAIMDHCTLAWGNDEVFSSRNANDMTLQNCLIGESLNQNGHKNYWDKNHDCQHGYAASIGGSVGSFHHNLLAHNAGRNWSMAGGLLGEAYAGELSIYNNVVYNWYNRTTDGGAHNVNFVNNYYKKGAASDDSKLMLSAQLEGAGTGTQEYYVSGNVLELTNGTKIQDEEGTTYKWENKGQNATWTVFVDKPYDFWSMENNVETAEAAFKNVLCDVGANFAGQDTNSKRLIQETKDGTYSKTGGRSGMKGLIDKESDSEGWKTIQGEFGTHTRPNNWDVDGDGIPAWFETAKRWDDADANNNNDSDDDYYTDLEEYLNWVAEPHFYNMADDGTVSGVSAGTIDLSTYFAGYTSPSYSAAIEGNNGASASVNGSTLTYDFASCTEKLVTINVTASEGGISLTRSFNFFIDASDVEEPEEPTVTPEGTAYTLSTETYKSSTNTTTWNFTPNDLTFTVTNANNKGYSAGKEYGVKYSEGVQYTIGIPTGIQVDYITFRGYDNYSGTDAYLKELNGTEYNATDYLFPKKDANENYTVAEHTIQLASPATGSLTFTPAGNQVVWVITLHTSKVDVNLPEVANTSNTANATVEGTITWNFEGKETSEFATAECSEEIKDYVTGNLTLSNMHWLTSIYFGEADHEMYNPYEVGAIGNNKKETVWEALVQPDADTNVHSLSFDVNVAGEETTFKPTAVEMKLSRFMTGDKYADITFNTNKIGESILLERAGFVAKDGNGDSKDDYNQYGHFDYPSLSTDAATSHNMTVTINSLASNKGAGIGDVIITGTLTYPKTTTVTLDEMATVHDLPAAKNVTVEMKRGLTAGAWNTFCVPFSVSKDKLQEALGDSDVKIVKYDRQEGTTLYFTDANEIVAGTPYLIKPSTFSSTYSDNMTPITFSGVDIVEARNVRTNSGTVQTIVSPEGADYSFVGTYVRYVLRTDGTEYGLNSSNKLIRPSSSNIMRGLRAFFRIAGGSNSNAKVVIGGELTSIDEIDATANRATGVYHVSGHYVREDWDNGKGLPRGLYIVNGRKMVRK